MAVEAEDASNAGMTEPAGSTTGMAQSSFREGSVTQASSLTASHENSDEEYEGSEHSESTWLSRAQSRTEELRKLFHLPPGEVGPYMCFCEPILRSTIKNVLGLATHGLQPAPSETILETFAKIPGIASHLAFGHSVGLCGSLQ